MATPAYKSALVRMSLAMLGYAGDDLYDLGEFDQKGSVRTRYGTKEYLACINSFHQSGIIVLADIVLNHKHGSDENESILIRRVNPNNRREFISDHETIEVPTRFTFPRRQRKYSHS